MLHTLDLAELVPAFGVHFVGRFAFPISKALRIWLSSSIHQRTALGSRKKTCCIWTQDFVRRRAYEMTSMLLTTCGCPLEKLRWQCHVAAQATTFVRRTSMPCLSWAAMLKSCGNQGPKEIRFVACVKS